MAQKKLFKVTCEVTFYMLAETEKDARLDVSTFAAEELEGGGGGYADVTEVKTMKQLDKDWWESIPYGMPDDAPDETCMQVAEKLLASGLG